MNYRGVFLLFMAGSALANDGIGQLGVGGLVTYGKSDAVAMRKEVLEISANRISVDYEFVNESNRDVVLPILFPIPGYSATQPSSVYSGQPANFRVLIDGRETGFKTHVSARVDLWGGHELDVTDELRRIGLNDRQIAHFPCAFPEQDVSPFAKTPNTCAPPILAGRLKMLQDRGLVSVGPSEEAAYPVWKAHVTYSWETTFPAGKVVKVHHEYTPFTAGGTSGAIVSEEIDDWRQTYCADAAFINKAKDGYRRYQSNPAPTHWAYGPPGTVVDYILVTANTWKGPIRDFTLRLKKSTPSELISLCFPGNFKRVDPLILSSSIANFVPERDLRIRFINPDMKVDDPPAKSHQGSNEGVPPNLR